MKLSDQLRAAGRGTEEWRVADPKTGCYCIAFSRNDSINPEREAREWLEDHSKRFPDSEKSAYVVQRVMAQNNHDLLMIKAASEIDRLSKALETQPMRDWTTPTTWEERFREALKVLCGEPPPAGHVEAWFAPGSESLDLQHWASDKCSMPWAQGIVVIDAAEMLADNPAEGPYHTQR